MADRETNDLYFGYPEPEMAEPDIDGDYVVLVLPENQDEREIAALTSLRLALEMADGARKGLRAAGFDHRVEVRDVDDPDKRLDWTSLES